MSGKTCPQCGGEYELDQKFCSRDGATLTAVDAADSLVGRIVAGRYLVLRRLGEGGMGAVYLAEHVRIKRKSALKVMRTALAEDADAISRFNREAMNASRIDHPNVAAIYDFGDAEDGMVYLAMEFVRGGSLGDLLGEANTLTPTRVVPIVRQIADALQAAHDLGIVHRDLKPDNIMVARDARGTDTVKLVDFGISKVAHELEQNVTRSGAMVGTPAYMSPEQVRGEILDGRSDVYSLGIVTFRMLTGGLPFRGESAFESMSSRLTESPIRLQDARGDVPWGVDMEAVMARVLATDRSARFAAAPEFASALEHAVAAASTTNAGDEDSTVTFIPPPASAAPVLAPESAPPPTRVAVAPVSAPKTGLSRTALWMGAGWLALATTAIVLVLALANKTGVPVPPQRGPEPAASEPPATVTAPHNEPDRMQPATKSPSENRTVLTVELLRAVTTSQDSSHDAVRRVVDAAAALLARQTKAIDSAGVLVYRGKGLARLGDTATACGQLAIARTLAGNTALAGVAQAASKQLHCR